MRPSQALAYIIVIGLIGCNTKRTFQGDDSKATPEKIQNICDTNNRFALDLYKHLDKQNVFFSPYSIRTALTLVFEGARGETAFEMQKYLYLPPDPETRRPGFAAIHNMLHSKQEVEIFSANALWAQKGYPLLSGYISDIERYYPGKIQTLNFADSPQESRKKINSWIEDQTQQKITDLLKPGSIDEMTLLVLTNAIYFNAAWFDKFDKKLTRDSPFWVNSQRSVTTKMMSQPSWKAEYGYSKDDTVQVLEMPYKGYSLSMIVILPKEKEGLLKVEEFLTTDQIANWRSRLKMRSIETYIPKVTYKSDLLLKDILSSMGVRKIFSTDADFSGMTSKRGLFVKEVIQQAFIRIHEEGTEAAAATTAEVAAAASDFEMDIFRADHPFLFLILDKQTGLIIFMGRISDPSQLQS